MEEATGVQWKCGGILPMDMNLVVGFFSISMKFRR